MSLNLLLGPVFSGKTTELVRQGRRFSSIGWSVLLISPENASDTSHSQLDWKRHQKVSKLSDACVDNERLLMIDDAHYFNDADDLSVLLKWVKSGKIVWCAGLDANAKGEPYKNYLSWIPKSDTAKKLTAIRLSSPYTRRFVEANVSVLNDLGLVNENVDKVLSLSPRNENDMIGVRDSTPTGLYSAGRYTGELTIIFGPMFAGKTTELLRQATRYFHAGATILFVNHSWNSRYGTLEICSHDGNIASHKTFNSPRVHFMRMNTLSEIPQEDNQMWDKIDCIFIEEGQFFKDILLVKKWIKEGKKVFISGLDGDAEQKPFGDLCWLVPYANYLEKQCALCRSCGDGTHAPFTRRIVASDSQVDVGSADKYEAVCRKHFV